MPIQYSGDIVAHNQSIFLIVYSHTQFIKMQNDASAWLLPHSVCSHFLHLFLFSSLSLSLIHFMTNAMNPIFKGKTHIQKRYSHVIYFTNSLDSLSLGVYFPVRWQHVHTNPFDRLYFRDHEKCTFPWSISITFNFKCSLSLPNGMEWN